MDFALGLYSFFSSFVLFNVLFFAYTKYKDPYVKVMEDKDNEKEKEEKTTGRSSSAPLISIVVPVKNEEDNIRNCVESCLNQTYENKEVIIVNDGSTDKTAAILDEIRKEVGVGGSGVVVGTAPALASNRTSSTPFSTSSFTNASSFTSASSTITNNNIINKPKFHIL